MPDRRPGEGQEHPQGVKHPQGDRLVVRKDAHRELEFRYDRDERLTRRTAPRGTSPSASFLKHRIYRVLLLNVLLLAVLVIVGRRLLLDSGDRARVGPYAVSLQALAYEDTVYVTVTVRFAGRAGTAVPAERFTARLALEPGGEEVLTEAALPRSPGEAVTVGEALPLAGAARARVQLEVGGWKRTLTRELAK